MLSKHFRKFSSSKSPYDILGLSPSSSKKEVKDKYYELARKHHPDLHMGNATKFQEINLAYQKIISGEVKVPLNQEDKRARSEELNRKMHSEYKSKKPKPNKEQEIIESGKKFYLTL
jgi:curved DNA-binding protein CbpA